MPAARARDRADETKVKPRSDAYVGLLALSLLALSAAMLFAFLNWNLFPEKPKPVQMAPAGGAARPLPPGPALAPPTAPGMNQPGVAAPQGAPRTAPPGVNPQQKK